jgi:hypothetical protein
MMKISPGAFRYAPNRPTMREGEGNAYRHEAHFRSGLDRYIVWVFYQELNLEKSRNYFLRWQQQTNVICVKANVT